jgi:hypothetical protein
LALQRLAASRAALQREMIGPRGVRELLDGHGLSLPGRWRGRLAALWRFTRQHARRQPVLATMVTAAEQWWQRHPWRAPSELAMLELRAQLVPRIRQNPWQSVALAAGLGAAVAASRPWRRRWLTQSLAPLPARLTHWAFEELKRLPLQALITRLLLAAAEPSPQRTD